MLKQRIKLRFERQEDLNLVNMVAEKQGLTLEQLTHKLLHKAVLDYLEERKAHANNVSSSN